MIHLNRSAWNVLVAVGIVLLAVLAGCWVTSRRELPPPAVFVTRTPTAIPITVRPVTSTPTELSPTQTPTAKPSAPALATRTFTPNPSTLITPSPQVLPPTGASQPASVVVWLLAGGMILLLIGLLARWTNKPKG